MLYLYWHRLVLDFRSHTLCSTNIQSECGAASERKFLEEEKERKNKVNAAKSHKVKMKIVENNSEGHAIVVEDKMNTVPVDSVSPLIEI